MRFSVSISRRSMLFVLHPVFALTGAADVITGPMLPVLARAFHLSDKQSGLLLFCLFAGMASGALLCRGDYAQTLLRGLVAMMFCFIIFPWIPRSLLYPFAILFGISIGAPMTAISLFVGRNFPTNRASTLTALNFSWSLGALLAPLVASHLLRVSSWQSVYLVLGAAASISALAVGLTIRDRPETVRLSPETMGLRNVGLVVLFALFFFLEVGVETTFSAWISTYVLRTASVTVTLAAAAAAIYWGGYLASRGLSPLLLSYVRPGRVIQIALFSALAAATLLVVSHTPFLLVAAILLLGVALAPVFPMALAAFFDRARHSSDSRFVLAVSGFGAAVFPWLVGLISGRSGSLRAGVLVGPAVLLAMIVMLPLLGVSRRAPSTTLSRGS